MKSKILNILLSLCTVLIIVLIGESFLTFWRQPMSVDQKLGWKATEHYVFEGTKRDAAGKEYHVSIATDRNGFRLFGNPNSKKIKIFFLGDSFTYGIDVSNDKVYCALIVGKSNNVEGFAYGSGGYGTLQEYMILDKFIDLIKPDILILQLCCNDFIDNDFRLGQKSYYNNNGRRRPYLDEYGNISYLNPKHSSFFFIPDGLLAKSRLASFLFDKFNRLLLYPHKKQGDSIETEISRVGPGHEGFRGAVKITKMSMDMIKNRAAGILIFAFSVDDGQPMWGEFQKLVEQEHFNYIDGIPQALRSYEEKGYTIRAADKGHLNELGHRIVADKLTDYLQKEEILSKFTKAKAGRIPDLEVNLQRDN